MVELTLRTATAADVAAVVDLVESAYRGEASRAGWTTEADLLVGRRTDAAEVAGLVAAPDRMVLLAVTGAGEPVGCCHLQRRPDGSAYFGMFAVRPTAQGGGVGGWLLAQAERIARDDWGARRMVMTVLGQRTELIAWYRRRGYAETGETFPWPRQWTRSTPLRDDLFFTTLAKPLPPP